MVVQVFLRNQVGSFIRAHLVDLVEAREDLLVVSAAKLQAGFEDRSQVAVDIGDMLVAVQSDVLNAFGCV